MDILAPASKDWVMLQICCCKLIRHQNVAEILQLLYYGKISFVILFLGLYFIQ